MVRLRKDSSDTIGISRIYQPGSGQGTNLAGRPLNVARFVGTPIGQKAYYVNEINKSLESIEVMPAPPPIVYE
jgi:hypothetical protein